MAFVPCFPRTVMPYPESNINLLLVHFTYPTTQYHVHRGFFWRCYTLLHTKKRGSNEEEKEKDVVTLSQTNNSSKLSPEIESQATSLINEFTLNHLKLQRPMKLDHQPLKGFSSSSRHVWKKTSTSRICYSYLSHTK